jgi:hypothetical protein
MKRVYKNSDKSSSEYKYIPSKRFTVEDDIYGGDKLIIRGKKHLLFLYNNGRLEFHLV